MSVVTVVWAVTLACLVLAAAFIGVRELARGSTDVHMRATWIQQVGVLGAVLVPATVGGWVAVVGSVVVAGWAAVDVAGCARRVGTGVPIAVLAVLWVPLVGVATHQLAHGGNVLGVVAFSFGVIEIHDSAAYLVGRGLGRRPLAPRLSPKKTMEGAVSGLIAAGLGGAALSVCVAVPVVVGVGLGVGLGVGALGADLLTSAVKRSWGVKDFGSYLPASGSVADVYDSYLMLFPLWAALVIGLGS